MREKPRGPLAVPDEQVLEETGRKSEDWYVMLQASGADGQTHSELVEHLRTIYGLSDWWANTLAVRYEAWRHREQETATPADLVAAMMFKPKARTRFEALPLPEQRRMVERIEGTESPDARRLAIREVVAELMEG